MTTLTQAPRRVRTHHPIRIWMLGAISATLTLSACADSSTLGPETVNETPETSARPGQPSPSPEGRTSSSASATPPGAPLPLQATPRTYLVRLTWRAPESTAPASTYEVLRDGVLIKELGAGRTSFIDRDVVPGRSYAYALRAVSHLGAKSNIARVRTRTTTPPNSKARLAGLYEARLTRTGYYGWDSVGGKRSRTLLDFSARCRQGPCNVTFQETVRDGLLIDGWSGRLERTRAVYRGTFKDTFGTCNFSPATANYVLRLRVVKARFTEGSRRATRLKGTLTVQNPPQRGCGAAGVTYDVTANR